LVQILPGHSYLALATSLRKKVGRFQGQGKFWLGKKFKDRFFIGKKYHCPVDNTKLPLVKAPLFLLASACVSMIFHWLEIPLSCGQYKVAIGQSTFVLVGKRHSAQVQNTLRARPPVYVITLTPIWILDEKSGPRL